MRRWLPWFVVPACAPGDGPDVPVPEGPLMVMATASDRYDAGAMAVASLDGGAVADVASLHADAVVRVVDGDVVAINRLGMDTVRRYRHGDWSAPRWEVSTGRGSNPQDVAACGGAWWVSRYDAPELWVLDPATGERLAEVDLSAEADADGIPEATDLVVDGDRLLVLLQRRDREDGWAIREGRVVAVDCAARAVVERWEVGRNPSMAAVPGGAAVLAEDGVRLLVDGELTETALREVDGAQVVDLAVRADGRAVVVGRAEDEHVVACLDDLDGGSVVAARLPNFVPDVALDGAGTAWVAVRPGWVEGDEGGVVRVDLDTCAPDPTWVRPRFPPFSVAFAPEP